MDLSPGQQKAAFVLIVVVLAALGYYLVVPALTRSHDHSHAAGAPTAAVSASTQPATASAPPPVVTAPQEGVNIYAWLPFTQQDLADAASVATRFGVDYDTYAYTESPSAYVAKMGGLITGELAATLRSAYATQGVATLRTDQKQVSTGTAVIESLRAFGPSSLTFIITAGQRLVSGGATTNGSTQYAVTVTGSGAAWQVSDIELESAGNT
ncbi:MAG TPA: hypothetical protein VME19_21980 [Streptosporangiaceae bacterium]|nr:hypothetical protein [Streptosporangiaceae bacterium]